MSRITALTSAEGTRSGLDVRLLVKDQIQQGFVDFNVTVVLDEAQFTKFVHEETDARPRGSNHLGKRLLTDFGKNRFQRSFAAVVRQEQEQSRQTPLA